jgi:hypothetical protein
VACVIPSWVLRYWERLTSGLPKSEHWDTWTRWYEARRDGNPAVESLERYRVVQEENFWRQSTSVINAAIAAEERRWHSLEPRPAPFDYRVVDGRIDVFPETAQSIDASTTRDLQTECLRKAHAVKVRLRQADESTRADVDLLLEHLSTEELRPGLILSSLRSLEATARAYDSAEGHDQLYPDALKDVFDLVDTLRDLAATFPKSREIEAEAVSLKIPLERLDEFISPIARVAVAIYASDGATEATKESLQATGASIGTSRDLAERAKQVPYHLLDVGNITRAGLRHLKATGQRIAKPTAEAAFEVSKEIGGLAADTWKVFRKDFPKRAGRTASVVIVGGIGALLHAIGQDLAAIATAVTAFAPLHQTTKELQNQPIQEQHTDLPTDPSAGASAADQASAPNDGRKKPLKRTAQPRKSRSTKGPARSK